MPHCQWCSLAQIPLTALVVSVSTVWGGFAADLEPPRERELRCDMLPTSAGRREMCHLAHVPAVVVI